MEEAKKPFEHFALVELFGHQRIAGKVTESEIGGGKFIRVDVPAIGDTQPLTRFYSPAAIYGITPLTEETAIALATQIKAAPISQWDARSLLDAKPQPSRRLESSHEDEHEEDSELF